MAPGSKLLRAFDGRGYALMALAQLPPRPVVLGRRDLAAEDAPTPLVEEQIEGQEGDLRQRVGVEGTVEGMTLLERKDREYLDWQGFYDRKKMGFGHFITPEEIEERQPFDFIDLFGHIPGVHGTYNAVTGDGVWMTARGRGFSGNGYCSPPVIVDRVPTSEPAVEAIVGVEVYRGIASVPIEFSGYANSCGLVLIWTKG